MSANTRAVVTPFEKFVLFGLDGELVRVCISVEPRQLEDLLDALASLSFPVNPELHHEIGSVLVEFPAYAGHVGDVRNVLKDSGFDTGTIEVTGMLYAPAAPLDAASAI